MTGHSGLWFVGDDNAHIAAQIRVRRPPERVAHTLDRRGECRTPGHEAGNSERKKRPAALADRPGGNLSGERPKFHLCSLAMRKTMHKTGAPTGT
ncbi:hypothetical protein AA103196_2528 [Ameyamaea chiangmaiensis NBRC 103196]|nr:hypothetical protein AA103196_2528 [Ameyamaea chiangmaiensis NBRC 103196]